MRRKASEEFERTVQGLILAAQRLAYEAPEDAAVKLAPKGTPAEILQAAIAGGSPTTWTMEAEWEVQPSAPLSLEKG